ncbi:hypothetical protein ACJJTC_012455 [Scirpophaga incertulas]
MVALGEDLVDIKKLQTVLEENCPNIKIITVTQKDYENTQIKLIGKSSKPYSGTLKVHQVIESDNERESQTTKENIDPNTSNINFDAVEDHAATTSSSNIPRKENVSYHNGDYILVKCRAKNTEYRYVALCIGEVDEDNGEIRVTFLKIVGNDAKLFKIDDHWYDLPVEDITGVFFRGLSWHSVQDGDQFNR